MENSIYFLGHFESNANGTFEKVDGKYMMSKIVLSPVLTIASDAIKDKALRILGKRSALPDL